MVRLLPRVYMRTESDLRIKLPARIESSFNLEAIIRFYAFLKYKLKNVEINHKIQYTMVIDTLDNLEKYVSLNPLFTEVVKFINENDLTKLETGKHPIQGDELFVNIAVAHGKTEEEATIEAHRQMIDIQIPMNTEETYGYSPVKDLPEVEYDEAKDCTLYPGVKAQTLVTCKPGQFAIFFPQDGHQPCIGKGDIHKAIFKVKA